MNQANQEWQTLLWNLFVELRKETLESQKIRAQVIGFKITLTSAAVGLVVANHDRLSPLLLTIPAFAAMFFDFLILSYTFSIKRIGLYCRDQLEPIIFTHRESFLPWEEFMGRPESRQIFSWFGNMGITTLATIPAVVSLFIPFRWRLSVPLLFALIGFLAVDFLSSFRTPRRRFNAQLKVHPR
jgi:hypothetical protein